ncbi:MAG: DNA adenine methylase [Defluviitaleaceae bacterium]|nr:DNA adenine methylase [Defluviitaleaceae bacterium]MCL2239448.1 DNA adenine methylase [Defluviitaleaceae bacterium]
MSQLYINANARPFVKWAGGKSQILDEIRAKYPHELGRRIKKYAEPFVGGGAVLFDVLNHYSVEEAYISDINRELVHAYATIRDNPADLIEALREIEIGYHTADDENRKELYYANRDKFNSLKFMLDTSVELVALFIFLNRTCFNGLYRVNSKGGYNVPQGSYRMPSICDENNIRAVSSKLQEVTIVHGDYRRAADFIDNETFAYFDPPYRPLSTTANFTSYAQNGFDDNSQAELAAFINELTVRGAYILVSNSDPTNTDEADNFFDILYASYRITRIQASRAINSIGNGRGKVRELLIANG